MIRFELAPQVAVLDLELFVEQVNAAFDCYGSLTTDEALVEHFLEAGEGPHKRRRGRTGPYLDRPAIPGVKERNDEALRLARERLGVPIEREDTAVAVARRLRDLARA